MTRAVVVDASALADALCGAGPVADAARDALRDRRWASAEHLRVEVVSVIRGRALGGKLDTETAARAVERLGRAVIRSVVVTPLLNRMWELRHNLSGYDAAYVAVAEQLELPLVTGDRRIARAPGLRCAVTLYR